MDYRFALLAAITCLIGLTFPATASDEYTERSFVNELGMTFMRIEPGSFLMGSPADEPYRDAGETQHPVTLTRAFYLQTTEVTVGQWRRIMGKGMMGWVRRIKGPDNVPITRICWHDVHTFIDKINRRSGGRYRLPTEAEWEYAARAGTTTTFNWGDRIDCRHAMFGNNQFKNDRCRRYVLSSELPVDGPAPVKSYPPNAWGLYDMHGNVWEWCQDWFGPYPDHAVTDPRGPSAGIQRVRRGGSWFSNGYSCRSANRANGHPASRLQTTGFRLVWQAARR